MIVLNIFLNPRQDENENLLKESHTDSIDLREKHSFEPIFGNKLSKE